VPDIKIVNLGKTIHVGYSGNLRGALMANGIKPYRGINQYINCHGNGHCATCYVKVLRGEVNEKTIVEKFHPLAPKDDDVRLSCQVRVYDDIEVDTLTSPKVELPEAETADAAK
jgi:ferredoxin